MVKQQAIEQYFRAAAISSFSGSVQSLAQIISRATGVCVHGDDVLEYLYTNNGIQNYLINICFANGAVNVSFFERTSTQDFLH